MDVYNELINRKTKLSVIGLGYVGMPIAVAFSKKIDVIGFDIDENKINNYISGIDITNEVGKEALEKCNVEFTCDEKKLNDALFHIVAVPTPIYDDHTPNLSQVISATEILGRNLKKGSIVVYESTVYPGVTEDVCIPILEKQSGLLCGKDFKIGYSPERINPGDKVHRLETITKIVSGMDDDSLNIIAKIYELVIEAGIYRAESIKIAEAAKVIENSQRDINIAFMNELSIIFNKMGIDTLSVLKAAGTKWNFLSFTPGLVGGHCIGIDPYYLTYKAEQMGYHSQVILSGRRINDDMGKYVAENAVKQLIKCNKLINKAKVGILGITFKENCPDSRNSKVYDIIRELNEYDINPIIVDPVADSVDVKKYYNIELERFDKLKSLDLLIIAISHDIFKDISIEQYDNMFKDNKIIIDVKGILDKNVYEKRGYVYWRL